MSICKNCNQETNNPKFCSRSCAVTYNNKYGNFPKRKLRRKCSQCDRTVAHWRTTFCQEHMQIHAQRVKVSQATTLAIFLSRLTDYRKSSPLKFGQIRDFARIWLKDLTTKPCAKCGYDKHVQLAHVVAIKDFPLTATLGEINSRTNVVQLCPNCHWELDHLGLPDFMSAWQDSNLRVTS